MTQATETNKKSANLVDPALQDLLFDQSIVLIGLIAQLTGTALQEDITQTGRRLQHTGRIFSRAANAPKEVVMQKPLLVLSRVRRVPQQFSWVDQRLVREHYIERCDTAALALYLFLITVADAQGLSYYADASIGRLLSWPPEPLAAARAALIHAGLIAYEPPLYQVLALDVPPATTPVPTSLLTHSRSPGATQGLRSLQEVLRQTLGDPS